MPIATGTAIALAAAAAATAGGTALSARSANKATSAQANANNAALAYEREKDAARKTEYDAGVKRYQAQLDDYNRRRDAILAKYGVNLGGPAAGAPGARVPWQTQPARGSRGPSGALRGL